MIIKRLPVIFLCLIRAHEAAIPSISDLDASASETKIKEPILPIHSLSNNLSQMTLESGGMNNTKSLLPFFKISDRMNSLIGTISALDTKAAVEMIETELVQILDSGACLHDIAPAIGSLPIEAKELVLTAMESKAYTLLKLLQKVYIWRDEHQYHWFMALSHGSPWYDKDMWEDPELVPLDWENNLQAICEWDNGALAAVLREKALRENVLGDFDAKLSPLCIKYDAISVFKTMEIDPARLKGHFESLATNSAAKLLKLYQTNTGSAHLHLEEYPFPSKLPTNVENFKFLMDNGYNFLSMERFIEKSCKEGRLDLLKYLRGLDPKLVPVPKDLEYAAAKNFRDILDWARRFHFWRNLTYYVCPALLVNNHFNTLYWWIGVNEAFLDQGMIQMIVKHGALEVLQWVESKQPGSCGLQIMADLAAKKQYLPVLEWLYEKFKLLPSAECLEYGSGEVLDWMKSKSGALESPLLAMRLEGIDLKYEDLIEYGPGNFELLQWVFNNSPSNVFNTKKETISKNIRNRKTMMWLYDKLKICPSKIDWAYEADDLEAIKWAAENCGICPMEQDTILAAEKGHLNVIKWIHENVYPKNPSCFSIYTFNAAISFGNLEVAEYLRFHVFPEEKISVSIKHGIRAENHLATLKWAHEHGFNIDRPDYQVNVAACKDDIETLEWFSANFSISLSSSDPMWVFLTRDDLHKSYEWLLKRISNACHLRSLDKEISYAYEFGSLRVLKVIHKECPLIFQSFSVKLFEMDVTRKNYHAHQWLTANGYSAKQN